MNMQRMIKGIGALMLVAMSAGTLEARQVTVLADPDGTIPGTHRYRTRFMNPAETDPLYTTHHLSSTYNTRADEPVNPWGVELGVSYISAVTKIMKSQDLGWGDSPKLTGVGVDLTGLYNLNKNHAFALRLEYDNSDGSYTWPPNEEESYRLHSVSMMPGYRFTQALSSTVSCFAGANIGLACSSLKYKDTWGNDSGKWMRVSMHDTSWGLAYSAEVGLRLALSSHVDLFVAYRFMGNTSRPRLRDTDGVCRTHTQHNHTVRGGVGVTF